MKTETTELTLKLTDAPGLLEMLWDQKSRPSLRWLREQQRRRVVPFVKIGRRIFFDPHDVRDALKRRNTVRAARNFPGGPNGISCGTNTVMKSKPD